MEEKARAKMKKVKCHASEIDKATLGRISVLPWSYTTSGHPQTVRELYSTYIPKLTNERERIEVYLAASSLEETVFRIEWACQLLKEALNSGDGNMQHDSQAYVVLARLGTLGGSVEVMVGSLLARFNR